MATAPATTSTTAPATNPMRLPKNNLPYRDLPMSSTSEINAAPLRPKAPGPNVPSGDALSHCFDSPPRAADCQRPRVRPGAEDPGSSGHRGYHAVLYPQLEDNYFRNQAAQLQIPVYLVQGRHEARGRAVLAQESRSGSVSYTHLTLPTTPYV